MEESQISRLLRSLNSLLAFEVIEDAGLRRPLSLKEPLTFEQEDVVRLIPSLLRRVAVSDEEPAYSFMHIEDITTLFTDGTALSGELLAEVPEEKARLSDCLNLPESFLSVKKEKTVYYLNKSTIQQVGYSKG